MRSHVRSHQPSSQQTKKQCPCTELIVLFSPIVSGQTCPHHHLALLLLHPVPNSEVASETHRYSELSMVRAGWVQGIVTQCLPDLPRFLVYLGPELFE